MVSPGAAIRKITIKMWIKISWNAKLEKYSLNEKESNKGGIQEHKWNETYIYICIYV